MVVSIDYRLAPEVKLPAIVEDVQDACRWVRERGAEAVPHRASERLAVMGGSAGGYLTLMTGFRVEPRPESPRLVLGLRRHAGGLVQPARPVLPHVNPSSRRKKHAAPSAASVISEDLGKGRPPRRFYLYCRQQGLWPREVAGHDPDAEPKGVRSVLPLAERDGRLSPDAAHPRDQGHRRALRAVGADGSGACPQEGVEHELNHGPPAGGPDGLGGVDRKVVTGIHDRVLAFLQAAHRVSRSTFTRNSSMPMSDSPLAAHVVRHVKVYRRPGPIWRLASQPRYLVLGERNSGWLRAGYSRTTVRRHAIDHDRPEEHLLARSRNGGQPGRLKTRPRMGR